MDGFCDGKISAVYFSCIETQYSYADFLSYIIEDTEIFLADYCGGDVEFSSFFISKWLLFIY